MRKLVGLGVALVALLFLPSCRCPGGVFCPPPKAPERAVQPPPGKVCGDTDMDCWSCSKYAPGNEGCYEWTFNEQPR